MFSISVKPFNVFTQQETQASVLRVGTPVLKGKNQGLREMRKYNLWCSPTY